MRKKLNPSKNSKKKKHEQGYTWQINRKTEINPNAGHLRKWELLSSSSHSSYLLSYDTKRHQKDKIKNMDSLTLATRYRGGTVWRAPREQFHNQLWNLKYREKSSTLAILGNTFLWYSMAIISTGNEINDLEIKLNCLQISYILLLLEMMGYFGIFNF